MSRSSEAKLRRDRLEGMLESATRRYLEAHGWQQTSQTVGHLWLWTRTVNGDKYIVTEEVALTMSEWEPEPPPIYCGGDHCSSLWNLPCDDPKHHSKPQTSPEGT